MTDSGYSTKKLKHIKECYDIEMARCSKVEQKASTYIAMMGVVATLLANGIIRLVQDADNLPAIFTCISLIMLCVISCLMVLSIVFAINALKKRTYYYIDINDINSCKLEELDEKLCKEYEAATKYNFVPTNLKVDNMGKAQTCMCCAALCFAAFSIILTLVFIIQHGHDILLSFTLFADKISNWLTLQVQIIILFCLLLVVTSLSITALVLIYKKK